MKGDKNKIVSLPEKVILAHEKLAEKNRLPVKQYMEKVLIEHVKSKK
jgi:hypothetical protein